MIIKCSSLAHQALYEPGYPMYLQANGGNCYLRYDDTNPEKEEEKFFTGIIQMVEWLGMACYNIRFLTKYQNYMSRFVNSELTHFIIHALLSQLLVLQYQNIPIQLFLSEFISDLHATF